MEVSQHTQKPMSDSHWHLLVTKLRQEARALFNLENQGYVCYGPQMPVERLRRDKVSVTLEAMFSRYLFIRLDSSREGRGWASLRSTLGVSHLVTFAGVPARVEDALIETLQHQEMARQAHPERLFQAEEVLRIRQGPFAGLEAIYQLPSGEGRALVLITLLGQQTRLRVPVSALGPLA